MVLIFLLKIGVHTPLFLLRPNFIVKGMQNTLLYPPMSSSDLDANPTFNVLIAYEDFESGKQAKKTYDFLVQNLGQECQFNNQMWKFDVLAVPKLREMAARDAEMADIIMISCQGGQDLHPHVKQWIDAWRTERINAIALVALFQSPEQNAGQSRLIREYLAGVARAGAMGFFAQPDQWPEHKSLAEQFSLEAALDRHVESLSRVAVQRDLSFPRWGINE